MLEQNTTLPVAPRACPRDGTDVVGQDGVVYRVGWGYGLQFHPLANVIALNAHLYAAARQRALKLREPRSPPGSSRGSRGAVWEYYFPYGGGSPPVDAPGWPRRSGPRRFARARAAG